MASSDAGRRMTLPIRLLALDQQIKRWIARAPTGAGRGRARVQPTQCAHGDGHRTGWSALVATRRGREPESRWHCHTPSEVKAAVTGNGRADKAQVGAMVTRLLGLAAAPTPADTADALALAICAVWRGSAQRMLDHRAQASNEKRQNRLGREQEQIVAPVNELEECVDRERWWSGRVAACRCWSCGVVEVGGVGSGRAVPPRRRSLVIAPRDDHRELATSLVVREDSLTLFGFASADERAVRGCCSRSAAWDPSWLRPCCRCSTGRGQHRRRHRGRGALTRSRGRAKRRASGIVLELKGQARCVAPAPRRACRARARRLARPTALHALGGLGCTA